MSYQHSALTSVFIAIATWLSLLPFTSLISGFDVALQSLPLLGAAAVVGAGMTLLRAPRLLTLLLQAVVLAGILLFRALNSGAAGSILESAQTLTAQGAEAIRTGVPPIAASPGALWLCLVLTAALILVMELLASVLEQPAWTIAPLALVFGLGALIVRQDLPWYQVLPVLSAYLLLLLATSGIPKSARKISTAAQFQIARGATGVVGAILAISLGFGVALAVPLGTKQPWNDENSDGPIQLADPTVQLDQDLRRPADTPILTYRSSDNQPHYLRTVALSVLTSSGARLLPMQLDRGPLRSTTDFPSERVEVSVQMADVPSEYLPVPFTASSIDADGRWAFDPDTMSIIAAGDSRTSQTRNLQYLVTSEVPNPTREQILSAEAGTPNDEITLEVPTGLDPAVRALTEEITSGAATAGAKAQAITAYLRSDQFMYSLDAPNSSSSDAISAFLLDSRSGYCIHFAAAMITMARISSIPARMAVGFAPGEQLDDGSFEVSSHDAHAWPELYFDSLGWVPFEPTPAFSGQGALADPGAVATPTPSSTPSAQASPSPQGPSASPSPSTPATPPATPSGTQGASETGIAWVIGLALLAALVAPTGIRLTQRILRLRAGQPAVQQVEGAWDELLASFADYGITWPAGSPVPAATAVKALSSTNQQTLLHLAQSVEQSRFSPDAPSGTELPAAVRQIRQELAAQSTPGTRAKATLLPASLWRR